MQYKYEISQQKNIFTEENLYVRKIYQIPDFLVSNKCCKYIKEDPCDRWAKEYNSKPFLGLMASEGGQREDVLTDDLKAPMPEIYGTIEQKVEGTLYTTGAQRTGCSMCGFGIHMKKRPHRFDQLRQCNLKEWEFRMYNCCTDKTQENGLTGKEFWTT